MNLKSSVIMEVIKNERTYMFVLPVGAPIGEAYDVAFDFLTSIIDMSKKAVDNTRQETTPQGE